MTCPTPIFVSKGPRPTDESNLDLRQSPRSPQKPGRHGVLLPTILWSVLVIEKSGILHRDAITFLWSIGPIAGRNRLLGNTHIEQELGASYEKADPSRVAVLLKRKRDRGERLE